MQSAIIKCHLILSDKNLHFVRMYIHCQSCYSPAWYIGKCSYNVYNHTAALAIYSVMYVTSVTTNLVILSLI